MVGAGVSLAPHLVFPLNAKPLAEKLKLGFIGVGLRGTNQLGFTRCVVSNLSSPPEFVEYSGYETST